LAGFLFLAVNALYIVSLLGSMAGSEEIHRPAVAFQATASAATIALAWSFYELLKPAGDGLALMALLFRVAEAALFGVFTIFSLLLLSNERVGASTPGPDEAAQALAASAQFASGNVGQIYFCAGSAIFFYLLIKGRFIPRAISSFGLVATIVTFASTLAQIGAPAFARQSDVLRPASTPGRTGDGRMASHRRRPVGTHAVCLIPREARHSSSVRSKAIGTDLMQLRSLARLAMRHWASTPRQSSQRPRISNRASSRYWTGTGRPGKDESSTSVRGRSSR
jgi:hypothetical protein